MSIVERDYRVPLFDMLRAGGRVTLDVSIVGGRVYTRVFIVDDLLMFLIVNLWWVWVSVNYSRFLMGHRDRGYGGRAIVCGGIIVLL